MARFMHVTLSVLCIFDLPAALRVVAAVTGCGFATGCQGGNEFLGIRDGETFNAATWNWQPVSTKFAAVVGFVSVQLC